MAGLGMAASGAAGPDMMANSPYESVPSYGATLLPPQQKQPPPRYEDHCIKSAASMQSLHQLGLDPHGLEGLYSGESPFCLFSLEL